MLMQSSPAWLLFFFLCYSGKISEIIGPPSCFLFFFVPQTYVFTDVEDEKLRKRIGERHTHICAHAHKHTQQFC